MQIYKVLNIDVKAERQRIQGVKYSKKEKKALLSVLDLFEKGDFKGAVKIIEKWDQNYLDFLARGIWNTLYQVSMGQQFYKAPAPIIKPGTKVIIQSSGCLKPYTRVFNSSIIDVPEGTEGAIEGPANISCPWELKAYRVRLDKAIRIPKTKTKAPTILIDKKFVIEK